LLIHRAADPLKNATRARYARWIANRDRHGEETTMRLTKEFLRTFVLPAAALAFLAGSVQAQQPPATPPPTASSEDISDEQLEKFSGAFDDIQEIRTKFQQRLESVQDPEQAQQLQQQANQEMLQAVEGNGMDPQEYNEIARAVNGDPEVQKRFEEIRKDSD
jgi:hypothetical protein